jgi:rod shape-determining protein MreD
MPARSPFVRRLMAIAAGLAPILIALVCAIIGVLPTGVPGLAMIGPTLTLMAVYYWSIFAPVLLPPPAVFVVGLIQDVLGGGPIGLNAVVLLAVHGLLVNQRRVFIARAFPMAWFGFSMVAMGAAALSWAIASAFYLDLLAPEPFVVQAALSVALYPVTSWLFSRVHLDPAYRS